MSGASGGRSGRGAGAGPRSGGRLLDDDCCSTASVYPSFCRPGIKLEMILSLNWEIKSEIRLEEMKPWTSGCLRSTVSGKKEADVKSSVETSREANLSVYVNSKNAGSGNIDGGQPGQRWH